MPRAWIAAHGYEIAALRPSFEKDGAAPDCRCGGFIKAATISFGQAMPEDAMHRAHVAAVACDFFSCCGIIARGLSRRWLSVDGQTRRSKARHPEPDADGPGRLRRIGDPDGHRATLSAGLALL